MLSAVVSCREQSDQRALTESFKAIHDTLVSSDDHIQVVLAQKLFNSVWSKLDDVACF